MSEHAISVTSVAIGAAEEQLVLEVLRSGHLVQGPMVERLEAGFRALCNVEHAVAVSSGTVALIGALEALGIGAGDEVVTSPFTFAATLNAIIEVGATARFADIDPHDFTVDVSSVEAVVGPRTRALLPVHLYGQPAAMDRIVPIAQARGLSVVEDAAQAHGATIDGRVVGSFGVGCFSLYGTKNITTGEGGIVTTDDPDVAERLRISRNQGMRARYDYVMPGHNWRLTDVQAAIGIPQLEQLGATTSLRQRNAARLSSGLDGVTGIVTPMVASGRSHVFHQYTVRVTPEAGLDRDALAAGLAELGIGSGVYYPRLVHDYDCYRQHPRVVADDTPVAARLAGEVLSLPVHPRLTIDDVDRIVDGIRSCVAR